jgi:colanic acid/amylovoran biosynthesis glycosyltransferase
MKLKIAIVINSFPKLSETFVLNQITGLMDLGHSVDIYSRAHPIRPIEKESHGDVIKYKLLNKTYYLDKISRSYLLRIFQGVLIIARNLKNFVVVIRSLNIFKYGKDALTLNLLFRIEPFLGKSYDIIQCHFGPSGNFGVILKEMGIGKRLVTMFHGYDIRLGIKNKGEIYRELFLSGDCFLANSLYSYKNLLQFGANPRKVFHHSVGVDIGRFSLRSNFSEFGKRNSIIILTVARLSEEKGLKWAIKAIRKLLDRNPEFDVKYCIVGDGPQYTELKKLSQKLGLEKKVFFLGGMKQTEVIQEIHKADIFLLPSIEEAFGLVLLEAQAAGLPVIATSVGSVADAIKDNQSGFIIPSGDDEAIADKLTYLIKNKELWPSMGKIGREFVKSNYDNKHLTVRLVEIYRELIGK